MSVEAIKVEAIKVKENDTLKVQIREFEEERKELAAFEIEDDEDYKFAGELLKEVKQNAKDVEVVRKQVTQPLNDALTAYRKQYKPALDSLQAMERLLKSKISDYQKMVEQRRQKALEAAAEAARNNDFEAAHAASKNLAAAPSIKGVSSRVVWDYEIVDMGAVPREFMAVDDQAVSLYMKQFKKGTPTDVPGLRFIKRDSFTVRTGGKK